MIADRYHVLRLLNKDDLVPYVVLSPDEITLEEMASLEETLNLHEKMIENYEIKNFTFVEQAIEHLKGRLQGLMDDYYDVILDQIQTKPV